jgi:Rieske Fe-S protein
MYALNLTCTHLGCTVTVTPGEIVCPCHGSRFDLKGNVLKGPAERPLARYRLEIREGRVEIYPG